MINKLRVTEKQIAGMGTVKQYYETELNKFKKLFTELNTNETEREVLLLDYIRAYRELLNE